jgi:hypothetical protein
MSIGKYRVELDGQEATGVRFTQGYERSECGNGEGTKSWWERSPRVASRGQKNKIRCHWVESMAGCPHQVSKVRHSLG